MAAPAYPVRPPQDVITEIGYEEVRRIARKAMLDVHAEALGHRFLSLIDHGRPFTKQQELADHLRTSRPTANRLVNGRGEVIGKMDLEKLLASLNDVGLCLCDVVPHRGKCTRAMMHEVVATLWLARSTSGEDVPPEPPSADVIKAAQRMHGRHWWTPDAVLRDPGLWLQWLETAERECGRSVAVSAADWIATERCLAGFIFWLVQQIKEAEESCLAFHEEERLKDANEATSMVIQIVQLYSIFNKVHKKALPDQLLCAAGNCLGLSCNALMVRLEMAGLDPDDFLDLGAGVGSLAFRSEKLLALLDGIFADASPKK